MCLREAEVKLTDQHQYEDNQLGDEDAFAREPFVLRFHCPTTGLWFMERKCLMPSSPNLPSLSTFRES
ncbi:hypothetical protein CHARACLAT_024724 [Characodon lateralis]|uniref:Uncharacterized protein n=1 Tax=Characodon lateralis TaxID=208331 RepID=A0ABU7ELY9_9TELE|nr:hypothetical protein [Characodon lateralis]